MSVLSAFEYIVVGVIACIVLFAIMVVVVPMLADVADANSVLMVGLAAFIVPASLVYKGVREMFGENRTSGYY